MELEITNLVLREAQLLDDWQLDDWLDLYAEQAIYWLPINEDVDPRVEPSIIYESKPMLALRVEQLMRQNRRAQTPRSECMRMVSNIVVSGAGTDRAAARYNLLLIELRAGDWRQSGLGEKRLYGGRCDVQYVKNGASWKILHKKISLLDRKQPVSGLSFIL
jgi:3-phenylpropionate/cinnamic acid dioxygenase small subunit